MWRDAAGRQCKRTVRDGAKAAARFLTARLAERDAGAQHAPDERFDAYAADWLAAKRPRLEAGTYLRYEADVRLWLVPAFGGLKLRQVTRSRIEAMLAALDAERDEHGARVLSQRVVPLDPFVLAALREHRRSSGGISGLVFRDEAGDRLTHDALRRGHDAALKAAGLGRVRLHDLRHSYGTLAVTNGMPLTLVQAQLGHRDVRTTMRYAHADADAHRAAAARVAASWRG